MKTRFASMLSWLPMVILGLLLLAYCGACVTDPATGKTTVDPILVADTAADVADLAESYVIIFEKPGPDRDKLLAEIEVARKAADLPALRRILQRVQGLPTTQPTPPPTQPTS